MPPSLDFNWQEGDEGTGKSIDDVQPQAVLDSQPSSPQSHRSEKSPGPAPWGYVLLLGVGVALGLVLGFMILTAIGQYNARADFSPIVEMEHRALAQGDRDLYTNLFDPEEQARPEVLDAAFLIAAQIYDIEDGAPRVSNVHLLGDHAEIEIKFNYDVQPYRRLENLRQVDGQWRFSRELFPVWGDVISAEEEHVTVSYRARDDFLVHSFPIIEKATQSLCKTYKYPEPCQIELTIQPDGDWPPNVPADGVGPLSIISPRLVGMNGGYPHPLWWSTLYKSIDEMLARRSK